MSKDKKCNLSGFIGKHLDPYSKKGKQKITKSNCAVTTINTDDGTIFFLGDKFSKEVMLTKAYFGTTKQFDEVKNMWRSSFDPVKKLNKEKVLITDGGGPKQIGLLLTREKGGLISRTLDKIQMMNGL